MMGEKSTPVVPPPPPLVKIPLLRRFGGVPPRELKIGRGYSIGEIKKANLSIQEARRLGIYVDQRRKTVYEDNVKRLMEWLERVRNGEIKPPEPTLPKIIKVKRKKGRAFRGLTSAGRRSRGLLRVGLRETHKYKWKRKHRERMLKKRHEARRAKGGH
ncbi:MAG: hypothetical protein DRJ47_02080 [Thermoprotei archaeon]|nr:MAG: hypothetical protein DRJ47_02080 [Thermoprotei archaeon]